MTLSSTLGESLCKLTVESWQLTVDSFPKRGFFSPLIFSPAGGRDNSHLSTVI